MPSDEALYQRLAAGDMAAFEALYRRYEGCLFGFILRQLGDRSEAEDVFHEAFMSVLRERRAQPEVRSFKAWIFEVARNLCLNRVRSRKRAARAYEAEATAPASEPPHPENLLAAREAPRALERAVKKLPEPLGQLWDLRTSGLSYDEIAEVLRVPLGTVKSRMHEMVTRLREEMVPMDCALIQPELVAYHFAMIDEEPRQRVEKHLCECPECLRDFLALKRATETGAPGYGREASSWGVWGRSPQHDERPSSGAKEQLRQAVLREVARPRVAWSWWERPLAVAFAAAAILTAGSAVHALATSEGRAPHAVTGPS